MVPHIDPSAIEEQRQVGWTDFHPETYCHRCGSRNVWAWYVDSELWNDLGIEAHTPSGIICPQCFTELWEQAHPGSCPVWELRLDSWARS
jgi:hypothetical protein